MIRIDVYHHWGEAKFFEKLDAIDRLLNEINTKEDTIMGAMEDLDREVTENNDAIQSAITLIKGIAQMLKDAGTNPQKLAELASKLNAQSEALAQAVLENTPGAETTPG